MPTDAAAQSRDKGENYCCGTLAQSLQWKILFSISSKSKLDLQIQKTLPKPCEHFRNARTPNELTRIWQAEELPSSPFCAGRSCWEHERGTLPLVGIVNKPAGCLPTSAAEMTLHNPISRLPQVWAWCQALLPQLENLAFNLRELSIRSCLHRATNTGYCFLEMHTGKTPQGKNPWQQIYFPK